MRTIIRPLAFGAALVLAGLGCMTASDQNWRLYTLGIAVALLVALLPRRVGSEETSLGHNARVMGTFLITVMLLLGLQLLRLQVIQSMDISRRTAHLPEGDIANVRPSIAGQRTRRGRIYDRQGTILADIEMTPDDWVRRTYSRDDLGHIIGFYNPLYNSAGLEATYDQYLSGDAVTDSWATFMEGLLHRPRVGADLHLTLDAQLQQSTEEAYQQVTQDVLGEDCPEGKCPGSVVLVDTQTGAILAMVSYPQYDPSPMVFDPSVEDWEAERERINTYWQGLISATNSPLLNRATAGLYPPGSTFKSVTASIAVDSGLLQQDSLVTCPNEYVVTGHAVVNVSQDLAARMKRQDLLNDFTFSCNTAFAQIGLMIGPDRYVDYAKRFGLTFRDMAPAQSPDFDDLPASTSTMANDRFFLDSETAMADTGYGQGQLQVTPLYMAMIAQTLANNGVMMKPYLVDSVTSASGKVLYQAQSTPLRVPISVHTAQVLRTMMISVVENGYGNLAKIEGVKVAAKTGTAETGSGNPTGWFIAYAPADAPRYAVAVVVEHGGHGSNVGAPIAKLVLEAALGK